jgi:hypothetical protein
MCFAPFWGATESVHGPPQGKPRVQVAYGRDPRSADLALMIKAVAFREMGIEANICGDEDSYRDWHSERGYISGFSGGQG